MRGVRFVLAFGVVFMVGAGVATARTASNVVPQTYAGVATLHVGGEGHHSLYQEEPFGVEGRCDGSFTPVALRLFGGRGAITFTMTGGSGGLIVTSDGLVESGSTKVTTGTSWITGVASDAQGDLGQWSFEFTCRHSGTGR